VDATAFTAKNVNYLFFVFSLIIKQSIFPPCTRLHKVLMYHVNLGDASCKLQFSKTTTTTVGNDEWRDKNRKNNTKVNLMIRFEV